MKLSHWLALAIATAPGCGSNDAVTDSNTGNATASNPHGKTDAGTRKDAGKGNTGNLPSSGNGSGSGAGTAPDGGPDDDDDPNACEKLNLPAHPNSPEILIVLDRSGSMVGLGDARNAGKNRWMPSVNAVKALTSSLTHSVEFGLMVFPATGGGGGGGGGGIMIPGVGNFPAGGANSCAPGMIDVPVGLDTADMIASVLDMSTPDIGATPTTASLMAAKDALDTGTCGDCAPIPKYVLLVTDGQPTCGDGGGTMTTQADIDATNAAIDDLSAAGIKTYVIGYDTASDADAATAMDGFAMHGGTDKYYPVEDEQTLVTELTRIAGALVPCEFELSGEISNPDYVRVEIDGKTYMYGTDWTVDPNDSKKVVLDPMGGACPKLRDAQLHQLAITRECDVVVAI